MIEIPVRFEFPDDPNGGSHSLTLRMVIGRTLSAPAEHYVDDVPVKGEEFDRVLRLLELAGRGS